MKSRASPTFIRMATALLDDESTVFEGGVVIFEVSGHVCGLPLTDVREIVPMCELAQPPGLPSLLAGLLNLRGEITPVVRTDRLFNLSEIILRRHTQILVLRAAPALALLSDRIHKVATVVPSTLLPVPRGSVFNQCLAGILPSAQGPIHVLRTESLLLAQERQRVAELQQIAQGRLASLKEVRP